MTNLSVTSVMAYLLSTSIKIHIGNDHKLSENINKLCRAWWSSSLQSMMEQDICGQENMLPYILLRIYLVDLSMTTKEEVELLHFVGEFT